MGDKLIMEGHVHYYDDEDGQYVSVIDGVEKDFDNVYYSIDKRLFQAVDSWTDPLNYTYIISNKRYRVTIEEIE